ncbi:MAG: hypothetical protein IJ644_10790 [Oscillospiraceae bacterium]|nr:hypothetical protein [Oscillospiraceae bacterium]
MPVTVETIVPRHKMLGFYGVPIEGGTVVYRRMQYFTELTKNKNPEENERKYVDEKFKRSDIVGYFESVSYAFDRYRDNAVLDDIAKISNKELIGNDAKRSMIWVDVDTSEAVKRDYAIIPESEGGDANTYTHSGNFKASGEPVFGTAASSDDWMTVTFTEDT